MVWQKNMARKPVSSPKPPAQRRTGDARAATKRARKPPRSALEELQESAPEITELEESSTELDEPETDFDSVTDGAVEDSTEPATTDWNLPATQNQISTSNDPLRRYLEEVRRYPMLDPETEMTLTERMRGLNDMDAAKALVQANLRLVVKIAFEYQSVYSNLLDLIQEGNVGLMKAVSKFDPTRGVKLGYYATWWIRSYILKYLLDNFRLVKIGTTQAQKKLFYHLMREKQRLEAQGLFAGPKLLAEKLDVREKDVLEMEQRLSGSGAEVSLDAPIGPSGEDSKAKSFKDFMVDPHENQEDRLEREQWLRLLEDALPQFRQELNEKELRLLEERVLSEEPKTLQEIADRYGLTRERARQIEAKLIEKLRAFLRDHLQD